MPATSGWEGSLGQSFFVGATLALLRWFEGFKRSSRPFTSSPLCPIYPSFGLALIGENHGFLPISSFVVGMTGYAAYSILRMLRFHPRLEEGRGSFYVAAHAVSGVDSIFRFRGRPSCTNDKHEPEKKERKSPEQVFHLRTLAPGVVRTFLIAVFNPGKLPSIPREGYEIFLRFSSQFSCTPIFQNLPLIPFASSL